MTEDPDTGKTGKQAADRPASWFRIWAELAGAWAVGVAHPLYVAIASGPEALTSYGLRRVDVLALVVLVSLIGPFLISLVELLLRRLASERARLIFHGLAVGALLSIVIFDWLTDHGHAGFSRTILPPLFVVAFAWLLVRFELIRNFVLMFSLATVVVIGSFLFSYPIWDTVGPHRKATAGQQTESETPVVMVIFDELPLAALVDGKGRIDRRHFRTFGEIASSSTWYPDATGVGDQTIYAVPSILTGEDPPEGDPRKAPPPGLPDYPDSLCQILAGSGYEVHAYEPITDLCARNYGFGTRIAGTLGRATEWTDVGFTLNPGYLREMLVNWITAPFDRPYGEYDGDRPAAVTDFVDGMPGSDRSVSVLHIALPHVRWMYQPDGTTYTNLRAPSDDLLASPPTTGENSRDMQMMMLQLAYADRQLKRVVERMKELGIWEKSLFVVTADHGAAFQDGGSRRMINIFNPGWILPVPLLIKEPGQTRPQVVKGPVDSRDITPTVLGKLGLKAGDAATGRDLGSLDELPDRSQVVGRGFFGPFSLKRKLVAREYGTALAHRNRLFPGSLYAVGGKQDLLGKKPVGLKQLGFKSDAPELLEDVDTGDELPAWVQGTLTGIGSPLPKQVAVALNGTVVAIAPVWETDGVVSTGVVVPSTAFVDGRNVVSVYEIPASGEAGG